MECDTAICSIWSSWAHEAVCHRAQHCKFAILIRDANLLQSFLQIQDNLTCLLKLIYYCWFSVCDLVEVRQILWFKAFLSAKWWYMRWKKMLDMKHTTYVRLGISVSTGSWKSNGSNGVAKQLAATYRTEKLKTVFSNWICSVSAVILFVCFVTLCFDL